jgi:hypothetical protein
MPTVMPRALAFVRIAVSCSLVGLPPWPISTPRMPAAAICSSSPSSCGIVTAAGGQFQRTHGRSVDGGSRKLSLVSSVTGLMPRQ